MKNFKNVMEKNLLSKREKVLLILLLFIILEIICYKFIYLKKLNFANEVNFKIEDRLNEIILQKEDLSKIKRIKIENEKLKQKIVSAEFKNENLNIKEFKNVFPYIVNSNVNNNSEFEFKLPSEKIDDLNLIKENFNVKSIHIIKSDESFYSGIVYLSREDKQSILPEIYKDSKKINKNIDLNVEYFKNRKNENNIKTKDESEDIIIPKTDLSNNQQRIVKEVEKSIAKNDETKEKTSQQIKEKAHQKLTGKRLNIDSENLHITSNSKGNIECFYSGEEDRIFIDLNNEVEQKNDVVIYLDLFGDYKKIEFDLFVSKDFSGDIGIYCNEKISFNEKLIPGKFNKVEFENVENFRGVYITSEEEKCNETYALGNFWVIL